MNTRVFEKIFKRLLFFLALFVISCSSSNASAGKNGISIEAISITTFVIVGIAIIMVYFTTKKK